MPRDFTANALRDLHALFDGGAVGGLTDAQLLGRFAARRAESAGAGAAAEATFAALLDRHGPMVWGVCLGILGDAHEAEDAFQATFLILTRRAGSVRVGDSLGRWLHGVARRVALRARAHARRRETYRACPPARAAEGAERAAVLGELGAAVGEEVGRLPGRYRAAVELCHLRGLTHEEAARELGWPVGTVKSRLARGRERLRLRLSRRGLAPAAAGTAAATASGVGRAAVPPALARSTVRAAARISISAAGGPGAFPAPVAALAAGAMRAMTLKKLMLSAAAAAGMVATGAGVYAYQEPGVGERPRQESAKLPAVQPVQAATSNPPTEAAAGAADLTTNDAGRPPGPVPAGKQAEDLVRVARELQERGRFAEAQDVLRKLAIVVQDWEGQIRQITGSAGGPSDPRRNQYFVPPVGPNEKPVAPGRPGAAVDQAPKPGPAPGDYYKKLSDAGYVPRSAARNDSTKAEAPGNPLPAASVQEQRIRRLEDMLEELLKRRDLPEEREGSRGGPADHGSRPLDSPTLPR